MPSATTASEAALEAVGVSRSYGSVRALRGVDLRISQGETVALVGESGSGKSTLLRLFLRLEEPSAGELRIGGSPASSLDPIALRRRTGYVDQTGGLLPHWTVGRNVELVPWLLGWEPGRRRRVADGLLERVGLDPLRYRDRYPLGLSGGERQRVAFARSLAADPPVLLLDEPFGALDALTRADLQAGFRDLQAALAKTVLLVTHDLSEAFRLADRVAVLRGGRLLRVAPPEELRRSPGDRYVADLLARFEGSAGPGDSG